MPTTARPPSPYNFDASQLAERSRPPAIPGGGAIIPYNSGPVPIAGWESTDVRTRFTPPEGHPLRPTYNLYNYALDTGRLSLGETDPFYPSRTVYESMRELAERGRNPGAAALRDWERLPTPADLLERPAPLNMPGYNGRKPLESRPDPAPQQTRPATPTDSPRLPSASPGGRATSGGGGNTSHGRGNLRPAGTPPRIDAAPGTTTATVVAGGSSVTVTSIRPPLPFERLAPVAAANRAIDSLPPVIGNRVLPGLGAVGTVVGIGGDILGGRGPLGTFGGTVGGLGGGALGAAGGAFVAGPIGGVLGGVGGGGLGGALLGTLGDALDGLLGNKPVRDNLPLWPQKGGAAPKNAGDPTLTNENEPDKDYDEDIPNPERGYAIRVKVTDNTGTYYGSWYTSKGGVYSRNSPLTGFREYFTTGCTGGEIYLYGDRPWHSDPEFNIRQSIQTSSHLRCEGEPDTVNRQGTEPGRRRQGNGATPTGPRSFPPAIPQTGPGQFPNFSPPTQPADRFGSPRGGEGNAPSSPQQVPGVNPIKPGSGDGSPAPAPPATNPAPPDARAPVADPQNRPKNPAPDNLDNPNGNPGRSPAATPAKKDAPGAGIQFDAMGLPVGRAGSGVYARANGGNVIEPKQSGFTNFGNGVRIPNEMLDSPEARKYYQDLAKALGTPGATLPDMPQKLRDKLNAPSSSTSTSTRPTAKPGETVTSDRPLVLPIPAPTKYTSTDRRPVQDRETSPFDAPDNANPSPAGSPCTGRCSAGIDAGVRQANQKLDRLASGGGGVNAGLNTTQVQQLNNLQAGMDDVLKRLGPQITGKGGKAIGIAGRLGSMWQMQFLGQVWNFLGVFFTIHNAAMLSRNLVSSVTDLLEQGLEAALRVLRLKDAEEDPPIDVAELITQGFQGLMTQIFGKEAWTQMQARWINLNRIITSAAAMYQNIQSMFDGARSLIELTANNVSRIGNAMKNSRVVNQNAYPWMPTGLNSMTGRTARLFDTLNNAGELADLGTTMAGEIINIDDEARELADNVGRFKEQVRQGQELAGGDGKITSIGAYPPEVNKPNEALEESKRRVSEGSDVTAIDMLRGDVPWEFIGDKPKDD